jgi:crossover junction endodeoxyribonuclease RuvC
MILRWDRGLAAKEMKPQHKRILAIDPGTRLMGIGLLDDGKLIYHAVEVIAKGRSPRDTLERCRHVILRLIADFQPNVIAVERTFFAMNRNAALLNVLFDEIRAIARRKGLTFVTFAPSSVKKFICGNGHAGKKEVATVVAARFSELKVFLTQDRGWKERFHQNMFDAVALAIMAAESEWRPRRAA